MRTAALLASLVLAVASPGRGRADGLVRQLPEDGAWASFYCTEEFDDGLKREHYVTIKSVGRERAGGEPCRWVELAYHRDAARTKGTGGAWKLLIPEKHLGPDGDPLGHVVRAWRKGADGLQPGGLDDGRPRLDLVMPPAIPGLKEVRDEQHFDWQRGRLTSTRALVGAARHAHRVEMVQTSYRLALSDRVPFGVAGAKIELESNIGYKGTVQYWLVDMGSGATSDLPDAK